MNFSVRTATQNDVAEMHKMMVELAIFEEALDEVFATEQDLHRVLFGSASNSGDNTNQNSIVSAHVVDGPDGLAAMAIWFLTYSTWQGRYGIYLEDLYVRPAFRGQGIGTSLLNKLAQVCQENDYTRFQWSVLDWNVKAIEVYRSVGAEPIEGWTGYRLTGEPLKALAQSKE